MFSQSFCMQKSHHDKQMQDDLRYFASRQWTLPFEYRGSYVNALKDYTHQKRKKNILIAGACVSVALIGAVVVFKTSWCYMGSGAIVGLASLFSAAGIYDARREHKNLGILNKNDNSSEHQEKITKIGQNALYDSIKRIKVEKPKGEFGAKKLIIKNPVESIMLWDGIHPTVFKAILEKRYNNSQWTLKQEE
jgi:hypothetical protein